MYTVVLNYDHDLLLTLTFAAIYVGFNYRNSYTHIMMLQYSFVMSIHHTLNSPKAIEHFPITPCLWTLARILQASEWCRRCN